MQRSLDTSVIRARNSRWWAATRLLGGGAGLGSFSSSHGVGNAYSDVGMLACKSEEIAKYVSTQFGELVFDACFARHFEGREFEWLD